jgi:hypothetical protein
MSIRIPTTAVDKRGWRLYADIDLETAVHLFDGELFRLLQLEVRRLHAQIEDNKDEGKALRELAKKCADLGIKPAPPAPPKE